MIEAKVKVKLTRKELFENVSAKTGMRVSEVSPIMEALIEILKQGLYDSRAIELRNFGSFMVKKRKGRMEARNPKNGELVRVESHGAVVFKPGKELRTGAWELRE